MFNLITFFYFIILIINAFLLQLEPTKTTIEDIITRPYSYKGKYVEINGLVNLYIQGPGGTNYYLLRGDYGGIIRVNTQESSPVINKKYIVRGIIYTEEESFPKRQLSVFMSEKERIALEFPVPTFFVEPKEINEGQIAFLNWNAPSASKVLINGEEVNAYGKREIMTKETKSFHLVAIYPDGSSKESKVTIKVNKSILMNLLKDHVIFILFGILLISLVFIVFYVFIKRPVSQKFPYVSPTMNQEMNRKEFIEDKFVYTTDDEFRTIKIVKNPLKTLKFIPGKFLIISGEDKGKELRIAGYPTKAGFVVSIGRKEVTGDKAFAHIQLKEKTVSREQAEFIYNDNKLYVRNLSETNYTQLNGIDLKPGEISEVYPKSIIKFGEVEFQYLV